MKQLLITIAAVVLVGCGESQQSVPQVETKPVEPVAEAAQPEPPTAKAPDISIFDAAITGKIEAVRQHIDAGSDVNVKDRLGVTPLHYANGNGHKEIVVLLITEGADVNAKNGKGWTPLFGAAVLGKNKIVELLIAKGANVNAMDNDGETPLTYAGDSEIIDLLRKHGAKTAEELKAAGKPTEPVDISIHEGAITGNIEAVKKHITAGVDVNAQNFGRNTALHWAAYHGHKEIAELLIGNGADVNAKEEFEQTPLHKAVKASDKAVAKIRLLSLGVDLDVEDEDGASNWYDMVLLKQKEIVELLITNGANLNATEQNGTTPLDSAKGEIADLLRKHGAKTGEELKAEGK